MSPTQYINNDINFEEEKAQNELANISFINNSNRVWKLFYNIAARISLKNYLERIHMHI